MTAVTRRTFLALDHPKGSPERNRLNEDPRTSEYLTSYRYAVGTARTFRTRDEAEAFAATLTAPRKDRR